MAPLPLPVMMSRWQNVDLWWEAPNQWLMTHELPVRRVTDIETLDLFGDEAFRRRDEIIAVGYNDYSPEVAELISRRVVAALKHVGWAIEVDEPLEHTGDTFRAVRGSEYLRVRVSAEEDHLMQLECVDGGQLEGHVGTIEAWLLEHGFSVEQRGAVTGIVTSARVNLQRLSEL